MMYAENKIDSILFKEWVKNWDEKEFERYMQNTYPQLAVSREINNLIVEIKKACDSFDSDSSLDYIRGIASPLIKKCYFKADNSTIAVANLYETLILPADLHTRKRLMKGYDNDEIETGRITFKKSDKIVGEIGEMSDLYWSVFYDQFVKEIDEEFSIDGNEKFILQKMAYTQNHKNYLTLQIWDPTIFKDFSMFVEEALYYVSNQFNLNFKRAFFDDLQHEIGRDGTYELDLTFQPLEETPLLYYNSANYSTLPRIAFLAYYQVIEYFYVRANNLLFQQNLLDANIVDIQNVDFEAVHRSIENFRKYSTEENALGLVLKRSVSLGEFNAWLNSELQYLTQVDRAHPQIVPIDTTQENKFYTSLSRRVYAIRCSIVHAKGDTNKLLLVPMISEELVRKELPLIKFLSSKTIEKWSK